MNYDTTATEVQQVREESLLIQEAEEPCNLAPLEENELQEVVGGGGAKVMTKSLIDPYETPGLEDFA